jgi:short-subunit dehydrogenase
MDLKDRYGQWALVTGASAGIGKEFAIALAKQGIACAITARREDRLHALAKELESKYKVATRVIACDLAAADGADKLAAAVADLPIAILVNNAGFGYSGRFEKLETERLRAMVQVNCMVPVVLTSLILPAMRKRGRGAVIIVGSVAGYQPLPLHAVYSATKSFDLLFGEALWGELRGTGIDAIVLAPGETDTEFHEVAGEQGAKGEPASNVVQVCLEALGRQPSVISGWFNWARAQTSRVVPRALAVTIAQKVIEGYTPEAMR